MYKETLQNGVTRLHPIRKDGSVLMIHEGKRDQITKGLGLPISFIEQRLQDGWSDERALSLGRNYVMKDGHIFYLYNRKGREVYISLEDMERAEVDWGITTTTVGKRLGKGHSVEKALTTPRKEDLHFFGMREYMKKQEKIRSERAVSQMREQKYRERKPHLYDGTPQQHTFNEYAQYLADSYKFKCAEVVQ